MKCIIAEECMHGFRESAPVVAPPPAFQKGKKILGNHEISTLFALNAMVNF